MRLEDRIREELAHHVSHDGPSERAWEEIQARLRRRPEFLRRSFSAVAALLVAAAGIGLGAWAFLGNRDVGPSGSIWRGLWPQESMNRAERAQAAADRGDDTYAWQLGRDGAEVVLRYAREKLDWTKPYSLGALVREETLRRFHVIQCGPGPNPDYPEIGCAPGPDRTYPAAYITVERLLRQGEGGLWFVTRIEPTAVHQPEPASEEEVRKFVSAFLAQRVQGSGAEEFLSREGIGQFGGELKLSPLYGSTPALHYELYEIASIDGPLWPESDFEVGVRIFTRSGGTIEETLFVGPNVDLQGQQSPLLINGGRKGLSGP